MSLSTAWPITQLFALSTTIAADVVTAALPAGTDKASLIVIDKILARGQSSAATPLFTITVNGVIIASTTGVAATNTTQFNLDFPAGFPLWGAGGRDAIAAVSPTVLFTGPATVTNATLLVFFHYVALSTLRDY